MLFEGIRVVELGVWVAGPAAAGVMADLGADVVKIEPPSGDPMRSVGPVVAGLDLPSSPPFTLDDRGKRSVVLDLKEEEGLDTARETAAGSGCSDSRRSATGSGFWKPSSERLRERGVLG